MGIGGQVSKIYLVLNILEIPPFEIRFEPKIGWALLGYQMIHSTIQVKQGMYSKKKIDTSEKGKTHQRTL